jgi:hypothetical protein
VRGVNAQEQQLATAGYSQVRRLLDGSTVWKHGVSGQLVRVRPRDAWEGPLDEAVSGLLSAAGMRVVEAVYVGGASTVALEHTRLRVQAVAQTDGDDVVVRFRRAP